MKMQKQASVETHWRCQEVSHLTRGVKVSFSLSGQVILKLWIWDKESKQLRWEQQEEVEAGAGECGVGEGKKGPFRPLQCFWAGSGHSSLVSRGHSHYTPCKANFRDKAQNLLPLLLWSHCFQSQKFKRAKGLKVLWYHTLALLGAQRVCITYRNACTLGVVWPPTEKPGAQKG